VNSSGTCYFLFNGDLYNDYATGNGNSEPTVGEFHDGVELFQNLENCQSESAFLQSISSLEGPFAFIFYNRSKSELWFGRDFFGRESLLLSYDNDYPDSLILSSVSVFQNVFEVPAYGIYCYKIFESQIIAFPWTSHHRDQINENFINFTTFLEGKDINMQVHPELRVKCIPTLLKTNKIPRDPSQADAVLNQLTRLTSSDPIELLYQVAQILERETEQFLIHLRSAVQKRVRVQPPYCQACVRPTPRQSPGQCQHSKVGILFSGGIDSMVLAYLAAECLQPGESLDLLNVAFYQDHASKDKVEIPDRQSGLEAYEILKSKFPSLLINFIRVDVTKSEVERMRQERIRHLISPLTSVLDDSIGCCLWFAASGNPSARILLLGSGADELLGGYSRHRIAFKTGGWAKLGQEMQIDVDRISARNLGRDNRVISDHGVAPRMPFLDERVVQFLTGECDLWVKCCPLEGFQRGLGEKLLLRVTALKILGKEGLRLALLPKRAMQFGTRIAKLENSKEKGSDNCRRLN